METSEVVASKTGRLAARAGCGGFCRAASCLFRNFCCGWCCCSAHGRRGDYETVTPSFKVMAAATDDDVRSRMGVGCAWQQVHGNLFSRLEGTVRSGTGYL